MSDPPSKESCPPKKDQIPSTSPSKQENSPQNSESIRTLTKPSNPLKDSLSPRVTRSSAKNDKDESSTKPQKRKESHEELPANTKKQRKATVKQVSIKCGMCPRNIPKTALNKEEYFKKQCHCCKKEFYNHSSCAAKHFNSIPMSDKNIDAKNDSNNKFTKITKENITIAQWNHCKIPYYCTKCKVDFCFKCKKKHPAGNKHRKIECQGCHKVWCSMTPNGVVFFEMIFYVHPYLFCKTMCAYCPYEICLVRNVLEQSVQLQHYLL